MTTFIKNYKQREQTSPLHHFRLTPELLAAVKSDEQKSLEDLHQTALEMHEHGILRLPYPVVVISFMMDDALQEVANDQVTKGSVMTFAVRDNYTVWQNPKIPEEVLPIFLISAIHVVGANGTEAVIRVNDWKDPPEDLRGEMNEQQFLNALGSLYRCVNDSILTLIVALATRNVVKTTSINRRAHRGIGNGKYRGPHGEIYISTTVVTPPTFTSPGNGTPKCAHWRRGHKHTYLTGKGRSEKRERWIAPIFVNADPQYVPPIHQNYVVTK